MERYTFARRGAGLPAGLCLLALSACTSQPVGPSNVPPLTMEQIPGHDTVAQDNSTKEPPRLAAAESYMRTYLMLFGNLTALQAQAQFAGANNNNLFDTWASYLGALGLPNYTTDFPRGTRTNALMMATFERLGIALCDKAVEKELKAAAPPPIAQRNIFTFDIPKDGKLDLAQFTLRFDAMHQTFLSYPVDQAPTDRVNRFYKLYNDALALQPTDKGLKFTPAEAAWAAMCYGLIRHPEFHLY